MQLGLGGLVVGKEVGLLPHAAGQGHHIAGSVVNHHNAGLELLGAAGGGDLFQVRVDGVHLLLHIHIQGGIDMVAALLDSLQIVVPGLFTGLLPVDAVLLREIRRHIQDGGVHEPGVNALGGVLVHRGPAAALGAEIVIALLVEGDHGGGIAAAVALGPAVLRGDALLEDHLLGHGLVILLLGQVALVQHFGKHVELAVPVPARAVPDLALILKGILGVGVEQRGIVGDADEAGALRHRQALELLAEIGGSRALDAVAALAQKDPVQVLVHDDVFVVFLFKHLGPEDLHDLSLHGDACFLAHVLDELLGNGGAAELAVSAEEHIHAGLYGGDPVHTLVLVEPLVLNGHGGVDQVLGNFVQGGNLTVGGGINLLELLNISVAVHIVKERGLFQIVVIDGPVGGLGKNIVL